MLIASDKSTDVVSNSKLTNVYGSSSISSFLIVELDKSITLFETKASPYALSLQYDKPSV